MTIENSESTPSFMSAEEEMKIIKSIPVLENELTWICRVTDESLKKSHVHVVDEKNKSTK